MAGESTPNVSFTIGDLLAMGFVFFLVLVLFFTVKHHAIDKNPQFNGGGGSPYDPNYASYDPNIDNYGY